MMLKLIELCLICLCLIATTFGADLGARFWGWFLDINSVPILAGVRLQKHLNLK